MEKLKPCPFCGGNAQVFVGDGVRVLCLVCGARTRTERDERQMLGTMQITNAVEDVIRAWNRRDMT